MIKPPRAASRQGGGGSAGFGLLKRFTGFVPPAVPPRLRSMAHYKERCRLSDMNPQ